MTRTAIIATLFCPIAYQAAASSSSTGTAPQSHSLTELSSLILLGSGMLVCARSLRRRSGHAAAPASVSAPAFASFESVRCRGRDDGLGDLGRASCQPW
jgi:hypothetical protein